MFERKINPFTKKLLFIQYNNLINSENILHIKKHKIKQIFKGEEPEIKEKFLHNLISTWWSKQEEEDKSFHQLKRIIRKTKIKLNIKEKHDLFLIEERVFSIDRHIKALEVNYVLWEREVVGLRFKMGEIYSKQSEKLLFITSGELLVTNFRIILDGIAIKKEFKWEDIVNIKYKKYGFLFENKGKQFVIRIHDQITLKNTLENFIRKKVN